MQMRKKNILSKALMFGSLFTAFVICASDSVETYKPKDGYVPNAETAIRIAEAVWIPIYGEQLIESEKPFRARLLKGNTWLVQGSFKKSIEDADGGAVGGVALAEIAKDDGRIIRVTHGK
jgi:hypothetical protein